MATSYHPSDIQYVSDPNIQLQSMQYIRNSAGPNNQASSYQGSDPHDQHQNGNYNNGFGSSSSVYSPPQQSTSSDFEIVVTEEEAAPPPRTDPPKDFMRFSFCVMILCCFPIGLSAVQSARECQRAILMRNMTIADAKSQEAKGRAFLGVLTGITTWICVAAYIVLGVLS